MEGELVIAGIGVSRNVVSTIVSTAAERVEGVASVGENAIASGLIPEGIQSAAEGGCEIVFHRRSFPIP